MPKPTIRDVAIVGGGIGGVIALRYAKAAGLDAILLESKGQVGGIWSDLPAWQDIQFRREDWTLGDVPIDSEGQASIQANVRAWVDRYRLDSSIELNQNVETASWINDVWVLQTPTQTIHAAHLIAASGGHNRPVVPDFERDTSVITELHSSGLRDPELLRRKVVIVVGGGASAYDLLDLCFEYDAKKVIWIYRSLKWMMPTRKPKYFGTDMRELGRSQVLGISVDLLNAKVNKALQARYRNMGASDLIPSVPFDFRRHQLIPGRQKMLANLALIERHSGQVIGIRGSEVEVSNGDLRRPKAFA